MTTQKPPLQVVLDRLEETQDHGSYYMALCPAHPDKNTPSLQVSETEEGTVLMHCFGSAHCTIERIVEALGLTMRDLFVDHKDINSRMSAIEREQYRQALELKRLQREQDQIKEKLAALDRMSQSHDHETYYHNLDEPMGLPGVEYWMTEGMSLDTIDKWNLGYCPRCPSDYEHRPSATIPVVNGGRLRNIRHRILGAENGDKYRQHMKGLPNTLFNADLLRNNTTSLLIVEGEKKAIILDQDGIECVGIMGQNAFNTAWVSRIKNRRVLFAYDPDALETARAHARLFGSRGYVVEWPTKPDDMLTKYGASKNDMLHYIRQARPA